MSRGMMGCSRPRGRGAPAPSGAELGWADAVQVRAVERE